MALESSQIYFRLKSWLMRQTGPGSARRVAALSAAVASETGLVRNENQDRVAISRGRDYTGSTFILAGLTDGIGGMKNGSECAAIALGGFLTSFFMESQSEREPEHWLSRAALEANRAVHAKMEGTGGATLVAALLRSDGSTYWLSVGDSRVHHAIGTKLSQVSVDDTIAGQLGKSADFGIGQSDLLQFIGMGNQLEPHVSRLDVERRGSVLLTSDGVHFLDPSWLGQITAYSTDPGICVRRLVELSKWCGGPDNASVAMISLDAAPDDLNNSPETGYDIWDPFGELQIIVGGQAAARTLPVQIADNAIKIVVPTTSVQSEVLHQKPKRNSRKQKRSTPKPKSAAKREQASDEDAKTLKLQIQFPNKDT